MEQQQPSHHRHAAALPDPATLRRLALSDSGFVFDPVTGNSFTANGSGLAILRQLQGGSTLGEVVAALGVEFEVASPVAERDVIEFIGQLRNAFK